jgi:CHAT domain-containing protein/tetratricopeptide (TPR) repeat protein
MCNLKHFLLILFILICNCVSAQLPKEDSLIVQHIIDMGAAAQNEGQFDQALLFFDSASIVAEELNMAKMSIYARFKKIDIYVKKGDFEKGEKMNLALLQESIEREGEVGVNQSNCYTSLGQIESRRNNLDEALEYYEKGLSIARQLNRDGIAASYYMNIGIVFYFKNDFETALSYFKKFETYQISSGKNQLAGVYNNSAALHQSLGNKSEALEYSLKALELEEKKVVKDWMAIALQYRNTALLYRDVKKPYQALDYLTESKHIIQTNNLTNTSLYQDNLEVEIAIYADIGEFDKATSLLQEEIRLKKNAKNTFNNLEVSYLNLAQLYILSEEYEKSQAIIDEALLTLNDSSLIREGAYRGLYVIAKSKNDRQSAIKWMKKNLELYRIIYKNKKHPKIVSTYLHLAEATPKREDKLTYLKNALNEVLTIDDDINNPSKIIKEEQYIDLQSLEVVWRDIASNYLYWYEKEGEIGDLDSAAYYMKWSIQAIKKMLGESHNASDKTFNIKMLRRASENSIRIGYLKNQLNEDEEYLTTVLHMMEGNKSILLQDALRENDLNQILKLPDSIQQQKKSLEVAIQTLQKKILDKKESVNKVAVTDLQSKLFENKRELDQFKEQLERDYPKYKKILSSKAFLSIESIRQKLLNNQTALIEYLVTDSTTYQVVITKKKALVLDLELPKVQLDQMVDSFRKSLSNYQFINQNNEAADRLYLKTGCELYQLLLSEGLAQLDGITELIIIPDYTLGHIPFETLLTTSKKNVANYKELDYLLYKYQIRYAYSAQLLYEYQRSKDQEYKGLKVLGIASSYDSIPSRGMLQRTFTQQRIRKHLIPLPSVQEEVDAIQNIVSSGSFYRGMRATEANFKQNANQYNVLHLAMHGVLNIEYPMASAMAFTEDVDSIEDNFLYGYEIAQMDLSADLVVLSACETGYGKFEQGEGVMSLARSFMYAGVPSAIVSLWQVNDVSTAVLMQLFYENLNQGMTKSMALTMAKRNYIKRAKGIAAHPAYWAAFVCIGEDSPLVNTSVNWYWWIGGGSILIFLLVFGLKKRNFLSNE